MTATGIREQATPLPLDRKRKQNWELGAGSWELVAGSGGQQQRQGCPGEKAGRNRTTTVARGKIHCER